MAQVRFIKSASCIEECPPGELPEIAMVGRSNAGKSSLLNVLVGHKIAKISQTPGKTTLINFFEVDEIFRLVDLPGYGYASRSGKERQSWVTMIEGFLAGRDQLRGVILVIDGVRKWSEEEENLRLWLKQQGLPLILAVNKMDRCSQKEVHAIKKHFSQIRGVLDIHFISSKTKQGVEKLFRSVFENLVRT